MIYNFKEINILLVEDNEADIKLTRIAFENSNEKVKIHVARDGEEAIDYIEAKNKFSDKAKYPYPELILLDINLPKFDGLTILQKIKSSDEYKKVPVIMLSSSAYDDDIERSYKYGASGYIQKPVDLDHFYELINGFNYYWNIVCKLPQKITN